MWLEANGIGDRGPGGVTHGPSSCSTLLSLSFLLCSPREAVLDDPAFYWLGGPSLVLFTSACVCACMRAGKRAWGKGGHGESVSE